jgi:hypothetical protein
MLRLFEFNVFWHVVKLPLEINEFHHGCPVLHSTVEGSCGVVSMAMY